MLTKTIIISLLLANFTVLCFAERENPIPVGLRPVLHVAGGMAIAYITALGLEKMEPERVSLGERCVVGLVMGSLANLAKEMFIDHSLGYSVSTADLALGFSGSVLGTAGYYLQEKLQKRRKDKRAAIYFNATTVSVVYTF